MKRKVIVFDFDKTLTYHDTLLDFYSEVSQKNFFYPFKLSLYYMLMVLGKFNLISNTKLKKIGIFLFLNGIHLSQLEIQAMNYSKKIKLNKLFKEFNFLTNESVYVVSASFSIYLKPLFPKNVHVLGSEFVINKNIIKGLDYNCFKEKKAEILFNKGVSKINLLYTDSFNDYPLALISNKIVIMRGDKKHECEDLKSFMSYFNKK